MAAQSVFQTNPMARRLWQFIKELFVFGIKQAKASLFEQMAQAGGERTPRWVRMLPEGARYRVARARTRRTLRSPLE